MGPAGVQKADHHVHSNQSLTQVPSGERSLSRVMLILIHVLTLKQINIVHITISCDKNDIIIHKCLYSTSTLK